MPLSFHGLGSVESLMDLKMYQLKQLCISMNDEEVRKNYYNIRGIPVNM